MSAATGYWADNSWPWLGQLELFSSVPEVSSPAGDSRDGLMAIEKWTAIRNTQDS